MAALIVFAAFITLLLTLDKIEPYATALYHAALKQAEHDHANRRKELGLDQ